MNKDENNFEALRRLLAHKRQELPPPGYFNSFSGQIIARIRAGEAKASPAVEDDYFSEAPWLLKVLRAFEFKPAFAGAFASALSLLLVVGIIYAERPDATPQPLFQTAGSSMNSFASAAMPGLGQPVVANDLTASNSAANSLQPVASIFGSQNVFAQPVSLTTSGN